MLSTVSAKTSFLLIFTCCFLKLSVAQDDYTIVTGDLETWSRIGIKYKFNKKWSVGLDQQLRLNRNSSLTDQIITDLNAKYKFSSGLYFGATFRYLADRNNDLSFDNDFRFNIDAGYKHDINRLLFNYRLRYQTKNEIGLKKEDGDNADHVFRLKIGSEYNIKDWKFDPKVSAELFSDLTQTSDRLSKMRFTFGTEYAFDKRHELGAFYRIEYELNAAYPKTTYIIGLNYTYSLKSKR